MVVFPSASTAAITMLAYLLPMLRQATYRCLSIALPDAERTPLIIILKISSQFLDSQEVCIQPASSDFISSRLGNDRTSETCYKRSYQHHRATQARTPRQEIVAFQIIEVDSIARNAYVSAFCFFTFTPISRSSWIGCYVQYIRNIADNHFFIGQQCGTNNLQHFVFRSLRDISPCSLCPPSITNDAIYSSGFQYFLFCWLLFLCWLLLFIWRLRGIVRCSTNCTSSMVNLIFSPESSYKSSSIFWFSIPSLLFQFW